MTLIKRYFSSRAAVGTSVAILVLATPLSVIALMRLFAWDWWIALAVALLCLVVPIFGWIALIVLAVFGGIYLTSNGFSWQAATQPGGPKASFATMTIMEFEAYRRDVMPEGLARACKENLAKSLGTGGQVPVRASNYCECYGQASAETLTQADLATREKTGRYSEDATARVKDAVLSKCSM